MKRFALSVFSVLEVFGHNTPYNGPEAPGLKHAPIHLTAGDPTPGGCVAPVVAGFSATVDNSGYLRITTALRKTFLTC